MWGESRRRAGQVAVVEWVCAGGSHPDAKDVGPEVWGWRDESVGAAG